jgi:hypothetical protein
MNVLRNLVHFLTGKGCRIPGCTAPVHTEDLCAGHYACRAYDLSRSNNGGLRPRRSVLRDARKREVA